MIGFLVTYLLNLYLYYFSLFLDSVMEAAEVRLERLIVL